MGRKDQVQLSGPAYPNGQGQLNGQVLPNGPVHPNGKAHLNVPIIQAATQAKTALESTN